MALPANKNQNCVQQHARPTNRTPPRRKDLRRPGDRNRRRAVRTTSKSRFWGVPLWQVARGPDPAKGERVGHARAIFALGDIADGVIAVGGISRGLISVGGISLGVCSLGGVAVGLLGALGGVALAPAALGGVAVGVLACGGVGRDVHGRYPARPLPVFGTLSEHFPKLIHRFLGLSARHRRHRAAPQRQQPGR